MLFILFIELWNSFDLIHSKHLQAAGFEQDQAEALTEEFKHVVVLSFLFSQPTW